MSRLTVLLVGGPTPPGRRPPDRHLVEAQVRRLRAAVPDRVAVGVAAAVEPPPPPHPAPMRVAVGPDVGEGGALAAWLREYGPRPLVLLPLDLRISRRFLGLAVAERRPTLWECSGGNWLRLLADADDRVVRVGYGLPRSWSGVATVPRALAADYLRHSAGRDRWTLAERLDHLLDLGHEVRAERVPDGSAERIIHWGGAGGDAGTALKDHAERGAVECGPCD